MLYRSERQENTFYAPIGLFLREIGVTVPEIYGLRRRTGFPGDGRSGRDDDLWSYRKASWDVRRRLYKKTLAVIGRLHAYPLSAFPAGTVPLMEGFDAALYRWERDYSANISLPASAEPSSARRKETHMEEELAALALRLHSAPQTLIHRDFQSQNVMLRQGEPALIDFQGMRRGNPYTTISLPSSTNPTCL